MYTASPKPSAAPPRKLTAAQELEFTMQHSIPLADFFVDDSNKGNGTHYIYGREDIQQFIKSTLPPFLNYKQLSMSQVFLLQALAKHSLTGKHVVIFGSTSPWYEALVLARGAAHVTTIEYNTLTYAHDSITTSTPRDVVIPAGGFDVALSISSFDHDGLGRYGDPMDANADIRAMRVTQCMLKHDGVLFLTIPIGPDVIVYNLHRRYGRVRLPYMLAGWEVVDVEGWHESALDADVSYRRTFEPVFVLKNNPSMWLPANQPSRSSPPAHEEL